MTLSEGPLKAEQPARISVREIVFLDPSNTHKERIVIQIIRGVGDSFCLRMPRRYASNPRFTWSAELAEKWEEILRKPEYKAVHTAHPDDLLSFAFQLAWDFYDCVHVDRLRDFKPFKDNPLRGTYDPIGPALKRYAKRESPLDEERMLENKYKLYSEVKKFPSVTPILLDPQGEVWKRNEELQPIAKEFCANFEAAKKKRGRKGSPSRSTLKRPSILQGRRILAVRLSPFFPKAKQGDDSPGQTRMRRLIADLLNAWSRQTIRLDSEMKILPPEIVTENGIKKTLKSKKS